MNTDKKDFTKLQLPTSMMLVKKLVNVGKALLAKNASASIFKCSYRTSTFGSSIPTLEIIQEKNENHNLKHNTRNFKKQEQSSSVLATLKNLK